MSDIHTDIIHACADEYKVHVSDIIGYSRKRPIADARNTAIHLMRQQQVFNNSEIGNMLGGRHNSTVSLLAKAAKNLINVDNAFTFHYNNIINKLTA